MDDSTFRASFTMTANDIQNFLVSKNSGLSNFSDVENCGSTSGSHYSYYATYFTCGSSTQLASKIIYDAAQAYGINPQVILATLQKEESLITTPNPVASQLNYAMGYGCPDSGGCSYPGFFTQVDNATWQFRFDYERLTGGSTWWNSNTSYPCLSGGTPVHSNGGNIGAGAHYYSTGLIPGNNVTFFDYNGDPYAQFVLPNASTSALYCYTPHVFPGSSANYFSGSYWFVYYYSQWFGVNIAPYAFKSSDSPTIYLFINGFKIVVTEMGIVQDYGISPGSIQTLSPNTVTGIPSPNYPTDGISPFLSYIVKSPSDTDADGASVYLISVGNRYTFTSIQQFNDFGFNSSAISYLPLSYIQSISNGGTLSNYVKSPNNSVFQVSAGHKRNIFDYSTFTSVNPTGAYTPVSYYDVNLVPSGNPLSNSPVLVKTQSSEAVYLLDNNTYYGIPTFDTYSCWGFDTTLKTPIYRVADNSYLSPILPVSSLGCLLKDGAGTDYLLSRNTKYSIPASFGISSAQTSAQDILNLSTGIPTSGSALTQYIRGKVSSNVWFLESGVRKQVPTYSNFVLLNIPSLSLTFIDDSALSSISASGIKLGTGQVVKTDTSSAVYAISGGSKILYSMSDDYLAYGNKWTGIETYPQSVLDQYYPYASQVVSKYLYDQPTNGLYLVDPNGCYFLDSGLQTSYGQSQSTVSSAQTYASSSFPGLKISSCNKASVYIKQSGQALVYWVDQGVKHPINTWDALVQKSGSTNPYVINLSASSLQSLPTGTAL